MISVFNRVLKQGCLIATLVGVVLCNPGTARAPQSGAPKEVKAPNRRAAAKRRDKILSTLPRRERKRISLDQLSVKAQYEEFIPDEESSAYVISGSVQVEGPTFRLNAENVLLWLDSEKIAQLKATGTKDENKAPEPRESSPKDSVINVVTRLYAEGDVEYRSGSEIVRAKKLFFDFRTNRGIILEGFVSSYTDTRKKKISLLFRAKEILQLAEGHYRAADTSLTNCEYGEPHWEIHATEVEVKRNDDDSSVHFTARNATASSHGIPFLYLPKVSGNAGSGSNLYFKSLRGGKSSRFGFFALTEWGEDIRFGEDRIKFGEWTLHLDAFEERGFGHGLDVEYSQPSYFGELISYRIHDDGDDDKGGRIIENEERARARYRHRQFLPLGVQADLEIDWFSDRNFQREFFEEEFKEEKSPETVAYLKRAGDHHIFTLTGRFRINDFQTQTEYLPRATYDLIYEPLLPEPFFGTNLYYSNRTEVAHVRLRNDEDLSPSLGQTAISKGGRESFQAPLPPPNPENRIFRFDNLHRLDLPVPFGPFKVTPFQEIRYTAFEETAIEDHSESRFTATSGVSLSTKISGVFDTKSRLFKIRGLRHVITPRITYSNTFANTLDPNELIQFDNVDRVDEAERVRFELRNRLQTRRGDNIIDVLDFDAKVDYFPNQDRDNNFAVFENPDRAITRSWGNLDLDLIARLGRRFTIRGDAEYDFFEDDFPVANLRLITQLSQKVRVAIGYRGAKEQRRLRPSDPNRRLTTNVTPKALGNLALSAQLTPKWSAQVFERYDFRQNRNEDTSIVLQRIGHDWILDLGFSVDRGEDDTQFSVSLIPTALFQPGSRRRSRVGSDPQGNLFGLD